MIKKLTLLELTPKNHSLSYILFFIAFIISLYFSYTFKTYDVYNTTGIVKCDEICGITVTLPYNKTDILTREPYIKFQDEKYYINKIEYEEPYLNNNIPLEDIILYTDMKTDAKIINFQILYNKQRIITKFKNIIIERN